MSTMGHRVELRDVKRLIRKAEQHLKTTHRRLRGTVGKEKRSLEKRQATVWARMRKLADEYRANKVKLSHIEPAWQEMKREIATIEKELERLHARAESARENIRQKANPLRSAAARKAGVRSAEVRGEWWSRYIGELEHVHGPGQGRIPASLAIAIARRLDFPKKYRDTPDLAAARGLSEYLHNVPEAYWDFVNAHSDQSHRWPSAEEYAQAMGGSASYQAPAPALLPKRVRIRRSAVPF
jgi:archaellum component FlaC